jgi:hypothetical protein
MLTRKNEKNGMNYPSLIWVYALSMKEAVLMKKDP